ncbi:sensor histidine kinase [Phytohabitans houttuyneae]|uniref:Oxygen sensor histidine kinase NreB n=1 Tax=Phytohabitans houttuyneae TaxID=1076126 RepID=A0A6V8KUF5_9ACTN|nr:ATP-binding protein [Phytohabitans houttuyneae]GFJ85981.1 hypothetical protein Phou_101610 [Phytohabitans houttuyneae]
MAAATAIVALVWVGEVVDRHAAPPASILLNALIAVFFGLMGALVLQGKPRHLVGRLMATAGAVSAVSVLAASWASWLPAAWLSRWLWAVPFGLIFLALLVFPDARLPTKRWRPVAALIIVGSTVAALGMAGAALDHPRDLLAGVDRELTPRAATLITVARLGAVLTIIGLLGAFVALLLRWRRSGGETRQQLACLLPAGAALLLALPLEALGVPGVWLVVAAVVPVAMTIAILRYRLYELDRVVNRSIVWLLMSALLLVVLALALALLRETFVGDSDSTASAVATVVTLLAVGPLRSRVQRVVDRLLYGNRDEPYEVITRVGDLLRRTMDPDSVLPQLTADIADSMQVPYVAVELDEPDDEPRVVAEHGRRAEPVASFDMVAQGKKFGKLLVAPRSEGGRFTPRERRLLEEAAVQAAVAAATIRLMNELQDYQERLIMIREDERHRLRDDLHDRVKPALTGITMKVELAREHVRKPDRVSAVLGEVMENLVRTQADLDHLVSQLRPQALERGLAVALAGRCEEFSGPALSVRLEMRQNLDGLPAPVEEAAYHILGEALNNVVKHANARTCQVTVARDRSLTIEVVDDGVGIGSTAGHGVGLDSMRDRAERLGGTCRVAAAQPRGTSVRVELPIGLVAERTNG